MTIILGYPEGMGVDPIAVALANLGEALDDGAFAEVQLLCVSARRIKMEDPT